MRGKRAIDVVIPALATNQHGIVTRAQLRLCGLHDLSIDRRIAAGRLHPLHRGVYAVGHTILTVEGRWMAAVLAGGRDAVLSHASAAGAWELRASGGGPVHVTVPSHGGRKRRADIRLHRTNTLTPEETTTHRGIPITTVARTIVDLASTLDGLALERLLDRADLLRLVDFAWRDARLIVEVDGYRYHRSPAAFEGDRERDVMLAIAGWQVLRFTWAQVTRRPGWVARAVAKRLALSPRYAR